MNIPIQIERLSKTPKYLQISEAIIDSIKSGDLEKGSKLPSINQICHDNQLARETVVKAFNQLKQIGIIDSVHGKGFYVSSTNTETINRVFVLFDTFTAYKETLFYGIKESLGPNAILDIYFHHFNYEVFQNTINSRIGNYTSYIILPINHEMISRALAPVPKEKLFLLDIYPKDLKQDYVGIYQDFGNDIIDTLASIHDRILKYKSFSLIFRNTITDLPEELKDGFMEYCSENRISYRITTEKATSEIRRGEAYIVIDDDDLVTLVESALNRGFAIGKDVGIISYNDAPLKRVVGNGISVISTDFRQMGFDIAKMIKDNHRFAKRNKTTFINRGSF